MGPAPDKGPHWEGRGPLQGSDVCPQKEGTVEEDRSQGVGQGAAETRAGPGGIWGHEEAVAWPLTRPKG